MRVVGDRVEADRVVGRPLPHESAALHVTGAALYTDDLVARMPGVLHAHPVQAPHTHALVRRLDATPALAVPGVVRVLTAQDVPGEGDGGVKGDEPLFPTEVMYSGQPVCWVLGETLEAARLGALAVEVDYEPLPALVTVRDAIAAGSYQGGMPRLERGDVEAAFAQAAHVFSGVTESAGQEHFYLETQLLAGLGRRERRRCSCSPRTQHPTETQEIVAHVLGLPPPRGHRAVPAHGRRLRRQGDAGRTACAAVAALGAVQTGPTGAGAARPRPRT